MDLGEIRKRLDEIDEKIVRDYEERLSLCREVANTKIENKRAVYDAQREREKIAAVTELAHGEFSKKAISELYRQMMTVSRKMQYALLAEAGLGINSGFEMVEDISRIGKTIVYQGVEGAYAHIAALRYFGSDPGVELWHVKGWQDAMDAVASGEANYAVLPIENSTAGAVIDNYDLLLKYNNYIVGEIRVPIRHALLGVPGSRFEDIETVYSHPQGLMQCSEFFRENRRIRQMSVENTAVAAKKVKEEGIVSQAAIASEEAARIYGLQILKTGINNSESNTTRFIVVGKRKIYSKDASKISLCVETAHKAGALYSILGHFIFNDINMLRIESRPIPEKNWEYRFFIDIEGRLDSTAIINALTGIASEAEMFKILGCY